MVEPTDHRPPAIGWWQGVVNLFPAFRGGHVEPNPMDPTRLGTVPNRTDGLDWL